MAEPVDLAAANARIERLLAELDAHADRGVRDRARELVRLLVGLYGAGLERILDLLHEGGTPAPIERLAVDPLVGALLLVHDLHPLDVEARVTQAIERLRSFVATRGGKLTLVGLEGTIVRVRLDAASQACASTRGDLARYIERAVMEAAPEIQRVDLEGDLEPASTPLIQIMHPGPADAPAAGR